MPGQERGKSNYKPLCQAERLKKNPICQLKGFAKRFEDFDPWADTVHARIVKCFKSRDQARFSTRIRRLCFNAAIAVLADDLKRGMKISI